MQERIGIFETKLDDIKEDTTYIKKCIDGNGHKGLKERTSSLEVKFWIIIILNFILLAPISVDAFKRLVGG